MANRCQLFSGGSLCHRASLTDVKLVKLIKTTRYYKFITNFKMQAFLKTGKLAPNDKSASSPRSNKLNPKKTSAPWVEKYRPRTVEDVVEQNEVVEVLRQCLSGADLPNLLFYGPPGTGKTSTILAAARQLFGDIYKDRILELNASDERGIQVVREKVKHFAQLTASGTRSDGKPCPPFKIIILDEADSMTHAAQAALRRTMEKETKSTRFCFVCNYVSRIIPPLTSRCTKFRFKPLAEEKIIERLKHICAEEKVQIDDHTLDVVVKTSGGDMRRAITCLQSCSNLKGKDTAISADDVLEVTGVVPDKWVDDFINICRYKNYSDLEEYVENFMMEAYSASQMFEQLNEAIVFSKSISKKQKSIILDKLSICSYRLQDGGSEYLQLLDLGSTAILANKIA